MFHLIIVPLVPVALLLSLRCFAPTLQSGNLPLLRAKALRGGLKPGRPAGRSPEERYRSVLTAAVPHLTCRPFGAPRWGTAL